MTVVMTNASVDTGAIITTLVYLRHLDTGVSPSSCHRSPQIASLQHLNNVQTLPSTGLSSHFTIESCELTSRGSGHLSRWPYYKREFLPTTNIVSLSFYGLLFIVLWVKNNKGLRARPIKS